VLSVNFFEIFIFYKKLLISKRCTDYI